MVCVCCQPQACEDCCPEQIDEITARFKLELDGVPCCTQPAGGGLVIFRGSSITSIDETFTLSRNAEQNCNCDKQYFGDLCFGPDCDAPGIFGDKIFRVFVIASRNFGLLDGVNVCRWSVCLFFGMVLPQDECAAFRAETAGCCTGAFFCGEINEGCFGNCGSLFLPPFTGCTGTQSISGIKTFGFNVTDPPNFSVCESCDGEVNGDWELELTW